METKPKRQTREQKRLVRTKGRLACIACGRWTTMNPPGGKLWSEIPAYRHKPRFNGSWEEIRGRLRSTFLCKRELCMQNRPETM